VLIAVTGATGFVGSHVAAALVARGHEVIGFNRRSWDLASGPLADPPPVDGVVHCAARVADAGPAAAFEAVNVSGTAAVLGAFPAARRFVYVSTASVYDPARPTRYIGEDAPYGSAYLNHYARTKGLAEQLIRRDGRSSIILRPHAVYGPGDTTLLPRLLAVRRFGRLVAIGDGRNEVSVTHIDNLVQTIVLALEGPVDDGVFNVADAVAAPLDTLLRTLLSRLGLPPRILYIPRALAWRLAPVLERVQRTPQMTRYVVRQLADEYTLDISRARARLGYAPAVDFRAGRLDAAEAPPQFSPLPPPIALASAARPRSFHS
jgi:nucleoside-diphosphate-sugar epimerase